MASPKQSEASAGAGNIASSFDDRRTHARYPFTASAEVIDVKSQTRLNARINDLGLEGCYIDSTSPFPLGTVVQLRVSSASKVFESRATVVYSLPSMGMGLVFSSPEPEQLQTLRKWIGELSGEAPSEFEPSEDAKPERTEASSMENQRYVLRELVTALMHKGTLSNAEGAAMLQKLLR